LRQPAASLPEKQINNISMGEQVFELSGNIVDVVSRRIFRGTVTIRNGRISAIREQKTASDIYILPGLIDAHIHVESSMLIPSEFARLAVVHGTVATVSDPHEIANVMGMQGVRFMIENGKKVPFKFYFGAPSCVPATVFETSGATIGVEELDALLKSDDILYLSEMMNFPGVLFHDAEVTSKLELSRKYNKPVDGHAPGLAGEQAKQYCEAGITTDHECFTIEEALDKIKAGMKILIREGSAAKNFEALSGLIDQHPDKVMLCSDDKHPNDLAESHINRLVKRAIAKGYDVFNILRACTVNPVMHYKLGAGLLREGDPADLILVDNLNEFNILQTFVNGIKVAENGKSLIRPVAEAPINNFKTGPIKESDLEVPAGKGMIRVMKALDGQLITEEMDIPARIEGNKVVCDPANDILKIVVKSRYSDSPPVVGFVSGFGVKSGAIASCVAHDSHNIIAVGADDSSITEAVNKIIEAKGGISLVDGTGAKVLPLPVAGIMSAGDGYGVAKLYDQLDKKAKELGSTLNAPYMTLSFMALLVIPELKLSDKGIFDGRKFSFTSLFCD
jgi:adenine deaminase